MTSTTTPPAPPAAPRRRRRPRNLAAAVGGWSTRHRLLAVLAWIALVAAAVLTGSMTSLQEPTDAQAGTGESARALQILQDARIVEPATEMVLIHNDHAMVSDPAFRATVQATRDALRGAGPAGEPGDPYAAGLLSRDGHAALVRLTLAGDPDTASARAQPVLDAVRAAAAAHPGYTVATLGDASIGHQLDQTLGADFRRAEWTAVPLALGILLVVFGALVAAVLPVALAVTAFLAASGLLALVSRAVPIDSTTTSVMLLIGLAVGVDYCLFYVRRERDERARGADAATALQITAATSGRSVLISGMTVLVAVSGLLMSGLVVFQSMALGTMLVVLIAMTGSVTVLPALLSLLGDRVDAGRMPWRRHREGAAVHGASKPSRVWDAVLRVGLAKPWVTAIVAVAALLALAAPALHMRTEKLTMDQAFAPDSTLVRTYRQVQRDFPGSPAPARVVLTVPDVDAPAVRAALVAFGERAVSAGAAARAPEVTPHPQAGVVEIDVPLPGSGNDRVARDAVRTLRQDVVPATLGTLPGARAAVGGQRAFAMDWDARLAVSTWLAVGFVLALSFGIMTVSFRSTVVALTAVLLNLLSLGAAYGVMVSVFQDGHAVGLAGLFASGAIEVWLPLFVFAVLFGLSMDYHVFVVSRIQEAYRAGMDTTDAVRHGIRSTASTVTSAAAIMVAVFSVFAMLSMADFQQLGIGLAVAVLLDATVIRALLLPAVMAILGERNWGRRDRREVATPA